MERWGGFPSVYRFNQSSRLAAWELEKRGAGYAQYIDSRKLLDGGDRYIRRDLRANGGLS